MQVSNGDKGEELLLLGLREYSEACEAPVLSPDCPFYIPIADGLAGCGEECMDILGEHGAPGPYESVALGNGLEIRRTRRPRSRRHPPGVRPFDAGEILIEDRESSSVKAWRPPAIIRALADLYGSQPDSTDRTTNRRVSEADKYRKAVEEWGLDFELLVVPFLRESAASAVFACGVATSVARSVEHGDEAAPVPAELREVWLDDQIQHEDHIALAAEIRRWMTLAHTWAGSASLRELVMWDGIVPTDGEAFEPQLGTSEGNWLLDRLNKTYLEEWAAPSLHLEWEYLHGRCKPLPPVVMRSRPVDRDTLAGVIADKAIEHPQRGQPQSIPVLSMLTPPAISFLNDGRDTEAAALFEAVLHNEPDNAEALNNLGFCLIPGDPVRALDVLDRAAGLSYYDKEIGIANRVLVRAKLGRWTSGADLAARFLDENQAAVRRHPATLWSVDLVNSGGAPALQEVADVGEYIRNLRTLCEDHS